MADIRTVNGPPMIRSEDGKLVGFVFVDTGPPDRRLRGRGPRGGRARGEAAGRRARRVGGPVPLLRAREEQLKIVVPVTLLLVFLLLYLNTRSLVETGIVLLAVPFSLIGAIWLL